MAAIYLWVANPGGNDILPYKNPRWKQNSVTERNVYISRRLQSSKFMRFINSRLNQLTYAANSLTQSHKGLFCFIRLHRDSTSSMVLWSRIAEPYLSLIACTRSIVCNLYGVSIHPMPDMRDLRYSTRMSSSVNVGPPNFANVSR